MVYQPHSYCNAQLMTAHRSWEGFPPFSLPTIPPDQPKCPSPVLPQTSALKSKATKPFSTPPPRTPMMTGMRPALTSMKSLAMTMAGSAAMSADSVNLHRESSWNSGTMALGWLPSCSALMEATASSRVLT